MCILRAEHLYKAYQSGGERVRVLEDLCLEIERGELVAVMGASGGGKTTLLHLLCGIDAADSGNIYIEGKALCAQSHDETALFRRKRLGMIFQDFQLLESLNVKDNILVPMILNGCESEEQEQAYERVAVPLQLKEIENRSLCEISGGQKQRVAIARAFIHDPALIFADEPTGNLDVKATGDVMEQLLLMNRKSGTSVLIVTHDPYVAAFCDRVLVLEDRKLAKRKKSDLFRADGRRNES